MNSICINCNNNTVIYDHIELYYVCTSCGAVIGYDFVVDHPTLQCLAYRPKKYNKLKKIENYFLHNIHNVKLQHTSLQLLQEMYPSLRKKQLKLRKTDTLNKKLLLNKILNLQGVCTVLPNTTSITIKRFNQLFE